VNLTSTDLSRFAASGIPADLAEQAQLRRVDSAEGGAIVGRNGSGDYAGVIFPYIWPGNDGPREYRLRRDHPDMEFDAAGKPKERAKYLSPAGRANMLYFVPGTPSEWLKDAGLPAVITEGEKKALALYVLAHHELSDAADRPRWLPIALPGVWNWRGTVGKTTGRDGDRRDVKGAIPDLDRVQWRGRRVTILFDLNARDNESVQAARAGLTAELRKRGADVFWFAWPEETPDGINGIDDLVGAWGLDRVMPLVTQRARPVKLTTAESKSSAREFKALADDRYRLSVPSLGITLDVDRLRRERHELVGELCVRCELPGARTVDGSLSIADFNLSSARARSERAKLLADRANTRDLDWTALVEEFCQRVLQADRDGQPAVDLRQIPRPDPEAEALDVDGLVLPQLHPSVIFGDGGAVKSYTGLYFAGRLAQRGMTVALFDWELVGDDHRERLERLFGDSMPRVLYARCERPLSFEADRIRRIARENNVEFAVFDSVAFACDGPPESAEVAGRYFRAVRQVGCGSLHIAHVSKGENADQKPFGSAFWHNGARSTWYAKRADDSSDAAVLRLGLFNRKANLGPLRQPVGFTVTFSEDRTTFRRADVADNPDLAVQLSVRQRMAALLSRGAMSPEQVADEIEADVETVKRTARRYKKLFTVVEGGRIGLLDKVAS
jgi:hypothetical protein